jgi:hypothetical protein
MEIRSIGIDLGKTTFHLVALDRRGEVLVRRKFTQKQLLIYTANLQMCLIGLEACSGAHFLGRALREQGHDASRGRKVTCTTRLRLGHGQPGWPTTQETRDFEMPGANVRDAG